MEQIISTSVKDFDPEIERDRLIKGMGWNLDEIKLEIRKEQPNFQDNCIHAKRMKSRMSKILVVGLGNAGSGRDLDADAEQVGIIDAARVGNDHRRRRGNEKHLRLISPGVCVGSQHKTLVIKEII